MTYSFFCVNFIFLYIIMITPLYLERNFLWQIEEINSKESKTFHKFNNSNNIQIWEQLETALFCGGVRVQQQIQTAINIILNEKNK